MLLGMGHDSERLNAIHSQKLEERMKPRMIIFLLFLTLTFAGLNATERGPVAVSPGDDSRVAIVEESCPTFSWTAVGWAIGYRITIFPAVSVNALSYEEMTTKGYPVLSKEIEGQALSWTPSSDERLSNGGMYVWYVQAMDAYGTIASSEGKVFKIDVAVRFAGTEEVLRERLRVYGVSEEVIIGIIDDMRSEMSEADVSGGGLKGSNSDTSDSISIQGWDSNENTYYGELAGNSLTSTAHDNSFFGYCAGLRTDTGYYNTFLGRSAGHSNTSGHSNTAIGISAGAQLTNGNSNTFLGRESGYNNTTGDYNTFIGRDAGHTNTNGSFNTFLGYGAGQSNTGDYNVFVGSNAGYDNTTGDYNTFIGRNAGQNHSTGLYNTCIGSFSGNRNVSGYSNIFLGANAGFYEAGSNKLYIDTTSTSAPLIYGNFSANILAINGRLGVGTHSPAAPMELETTGQDAAIVLDRTDGATIYFDAKANNVNFGSLTNHKVKFMVGGDIKMTLRTDNSLLMSNGATCTSGGVWTDASSRKLKENIRVLSVSEARDALSGLNPVIYNYKKDKEEEHVGFIAEDVPELVASKDRNGMSPMDVVAVLTKVLQSQQESLKKQQTMIEKQVNFLQKQQVTIHKLEGRIADLEEKAQREK
jgi:hypothetical protein